MAKDCSFPSERELAQVCFFCSVFPKKIIKLNIVLFELGDVYSGEIFLKAEKEAVFHYMDT